MFEKEAEEYVNGKGHEHYNYLFEEHAGTPADFTRWCFQDGAEFGYNRANEWHYMKDVNCYEDLHFPPEEDCKGRICIWKVQVITEKGIKQPVCYHCGSYDDLWYELNAYHVIAWKEIVLPELKENEQKWTSKIFSTTQS